MAKRKESDQHSPSKAKPKRAKDTDTDDDTSSDEDTNTLNVEFEWFDPQPQDFHGLKTLLRQLFDVDAQLFDLSALTDLILSQPLLGSTVKVDGNETDPYAFLTVLNLQEHRDKPVVKQLSNYLMQQCTKSPALAQLSDLLAPSSESQVGLILTERLINIPPEVVPPMYNLLFEEIAWALEDKEPYTFSHYLIVSKTYTEVESSLDQEDSRPQKRSKKSKKGGGEVFYFHPEDEVLQRYSVCYWSFDYTKQGSEAMSDSKRAFQELGIRPQGHMMLIESGKLEQAVKAVSDFLSSST
ncbi:MAG: Mss4p nuclear export [Candelina submexicana]|nr:MAG: Mss4p nuclear export [Candelina submexicana]